MPPKSQVGEHKIGFIQMTSPLVRWGESDDFSRFHPPTKVYAGGKGFWRLFDSGWHCSADRWRPFFHFNNIEICIFLGEKHLSDSLICYSSDEFSEVKILWAKLIRQDHTRMHRLLWTSFCEFAVERSIWPAHAQNRMQFLEIYRMKSIHHPQKFISFRLRGDWPRDPVATAPALRGRRVATHEALKK